jgi:hypothetical protein
LHDALEEQLPDGTWIACGADHSHRLRIQEGAHGGHRGSPLPLLLFLGHELGPRYGEGDAVDVPFVLAGNVEAVVLEHGHHPLVFGEHGGLEGGDPPVAGHVGEPLDELGADTLALIGILDHEGDLCRGFVGDAVIAPDGDDLLPLTFPHLGHKGKGIIIVDRAEADGVVAPQPRHVMKAQV